MYFYGASIKTNRNQLRLSKATECEVTLEVWKRPKVITLTASLRFYYTIYLNPKVNGVVTSENTPGRRKYSCFQFLLLFEIGQVKQRVNKHIILPTACWYTTNRNVNISGFLWQNTAYFKIKYWFCQRSDTYLKLKDST